MGTLYLVATPIGNLEDISLRALRILKEVKLIAAEDTRRTRKLLSHYNIHTPLMSFYEPRQKEKIPYLLSILQEGDVALVSDAGTPVINDPGYELVCAALAEQFPVSPIPGPCAPIAALIVSGLAADSFLYLGYLPRRTSLRTQFLQEVARLPYTLVFLETPQRLISSLKTMQEVLGNRRITIAREMTKLHEEFFYGTLEEARAHYTEETARGEFTLVVAGSNQLLYSEALAEEKQNDQVWSSEKVLTALQNLSLQGLTLSQAAKQLASSSGWARKDIYRLASADRKNQEDFEVKNESG